MSGRNFIKVDVGFPDSEHGNHLRKALGVESVSDYALRLWGHVWAMGPQNGELEMSPRRLAAIVRWNGDIDVLWSAFTDSEMGLLRQVGDGVWYVRGWRSRTAYCFAEQKRKAEYAKKRRLDSKNTESSATVARESRASRALQIRRSDKIRSDQIREQCEKPTSVQYPPRDDQEKSGSQLGDPPRPPCRSVGPAALGVHELVESVGPAVSERRREVLEVIEHYRTYHPAALRKPKTTSREWMAIAARLAEGHTVEDLRAAIDGMHRTPFNAGENDRGQKYLGLALCMRTSDQVTRFVEAPQRHASAEVHQHVRDNGNLRLMLEAL